MHIGLVTDSLAELSLEALVETAQTLGIRALESGCGNWSSAPHLMSADPLAAIPALGSAIYHVHAKDTRIDRGIGARNGLLDITPNQDVANRSWRYVTLGDGHDASWWQRFSTALGRSAEAGSSAMMTLRQPAGRRCPGRTDGDGPL